MEELLRENSYIEVIRVDDSRPRIPAYTREFQYGSALPSIEVGLLSDLITAFTQYDGAIDERSLRWHFDDRTGKDPLRGPRRGTLCARPIGDATVRGSFQGIIKKHKRKLASH